MASPALEATIPRPAAGRSSDLVNDLKSVFAFLTKGFTGPNLPDIAFTIASFGCFIHGAYRVFSGIISNQSISSYDIGIYFILAGIPTFLAGRIDYSGER